MGNSRWAGRWQGHANNQEALARVATAARVIVLIVTAGCVTYTPPKPPVPRHGTEVKATEARTWDAVIEVFADKNIPIRTMERASGFISTDPLAVGMEGATWADCGSTEVQAYTPNRATYNVLVRGDSTRATVKTTVRWTYTTIGKNPQLIECSTRGIWEAQMETEIKAQAEAKMSLGSGS